MITLHYSPTVVGLTAPASMRPGVISLWWTTTEGAEKSMYLHPDNVRGNETVIASVRPAGVRELEWAVAVDTAVDRGARGETGRIAVEVHP
jgi:hypothetical protein